MKNRILMAALAASVAMPSVAAAQGLYGKADVGVGFSGSLEAEGESLDLETGYQVGGAVGYAYPNGLRIEGELAYTTNDIDVQGAPISADLSAFGAFANAYYDFGTGKIRPFVGAGLGYVNGELELSGGGDSFSGDGSGVGYQAKAGISFAASDRLVWEVGYRYLSADINDVEVEIQGATVGARFKLGS